MKLKISRYKSRLLALVKHPFFWTLTIAGNAIIFIGSFFLYTFEGNSQNGPTEFIDCLLWSMGTVTTVGYGNYVPQTLYGKWTIIVLMAAGTLFVWSYMAFLVTGLIAPELSSLEKDVHEMEREIHNLKAEKIILKQVKGEG